MPREAAAISVISKPGEAVRIVLLDEHGHPFGQALLRPHKFERIWDRISEAMALADAQGIGEIEEIWEL